MRFKKLLSAFVASVVCLSNASCLPSQAVAFGKGSSVDVMTDETAEDEYVEGTYGVLTYRKYSDHVEISGCDASAVSVDIPMIIDGLRVTAIGNGAFKACTELASVNIPHGITEIGSYAFAECTSLTSIEIPYGITKLNNYTFVNCYALEDISIPESVEELSGGCVFGNCDNLNKLVLPKSVYKLAPMSLSFINNLTDLYILNSSMIPEEDTDLGGDTDSKPIIHCNPDSNISAYATENGYEVNDFTGIYGDLTYAVIDDYIEITGCSDDAVSVDIPSEIEGFPVKVIGDSAFASKSVSSISLPETITHIKSFAFYRTEFSYITLPDSLEYIGDSVFKQSAIKAIDIPDKVSAIEHDTFRSCPDLFYVTLGNGVVFIGDDSFMYAPIESIELGNSLVYIGNSAFCLCEKLTEIKIPDSVIMIDYGAFMYNAVLQSVDFGNNVQTIKENAFRDSCIENIDLPDSLKYIEKYAFHGITNLKTIKTGNGLETIPEYVFSACEPINSIEIGTNVKRIESCAFNAKVTEPIETLIIPENVEYIEEHAFNLDLTNTYIYNPNCVFEDSSGSISWKEKDHASIIHSYKGSTAEAYAIKYDRGFEALDTGELSNVCGEDIRWTLTTDGTMTLSGSGDMFETFWLKNDINGCGDAFVKNFIVEEGITGLAEATCVSMEDLESISLPDSLLTLGDHVFQQCTKLDNVVIPGGVKVIPYCAFSCCTSLKSITLSEGIEVISWVAFNQCTSLENIVFPNSLTAIEADPFISTALKSITIPKNVSSIAETAPMCVSCPSLAEYNVAEENEYYSSENGVLFNKDKSRIIFYPEANYSTYYVLPETVTEMGNCSFYNGKLTDLYITNTECTPCGMAGTVTLHVYENSTAHLWAEENGHAYVLMTEADIPTEPDTQEPSEEPEIPENSDNTIIFGTDNFSFLNTGEYFNKYYNMTATFRTLIESKIDNKMDYKLYDYLYAPINSDYDSNEGIFTGACFGMSSVEILVKLGYLEPKVLDSKADTLYSVSAPKTNTNAESYISYFHLVQYLNSTKALKTQVSKIRTYEKRITSLIEMAEQVKNGGTPVFFVFQYYKSASEYASKIKSSHAVVIYDVEYGSWTYSNKWTSTEEFNCRFLISDPNSSEFNDDQCLYVNTETWEWIIPYYNSGHGYCCANGNSIANGDPKKGTQYAQFLIMHNDETMLDPCGILTKKAAEYEYEDQSLITVSSDSTDFGVVYHNDGSSGSINDSIFELDFFYDMIAGDSTNSPITAYLPTADTAYEYFESDYNEFETTVEYTNSLFTADASKGIYAIYNPDKSVEFAGQDSDYTLRAVLNTGFHPTDWYNISVSGEKASAAKLEVTGGGYLFTSDSLSEGIIINVSDRRFNATISVMTDYDSILIYEINETTIGIKVDTDGDGICETEYTPDYLGDVNLDGTVNAADLVTAQKYLLLSEAIEKKQFIAADINTDGIYDVFDFILLRQKVIGGL